MNITRKNFKLLPHHYDDAKAPAERASKTVPNEAMSIKEILTRYVKGLPITGVNKREPMFDPNPDHDNMDLEKVGQADLFEREEAAQWLKESTDEKRKAYEAQLQAEAKKKAEDDAEEAELKKELKRQLKEKKERQPPENQSGVTPH